MKKEYKTPTIEVEALQCPQMLCTSGFGVNEDEPVSKEQNPYSECEGYGEIW